MGDAIVVKGVTKTFGPKVAVSDLDLTVPYGGLYGFIGPNGAGKTTTIRMIMSILFPDGGEMSVLGHASALEAKDQIGYLPEERGVYKKMKVRSFLTYIARLKGCTSSDVRTRVREWLERVELGDVENKPCEELSKGMQQKVQFIAAVIHEPKLLILDEPFSGLDPVNMRMLRDLVREQHERGTTIIFSTHVMYQAEQICNHVVMINDGEKVLDDDLAGIRARFDPRTIRFDPLDSGADLEAVRGLQQVESVESLENGSYEIGLVEGTDAARVMQEIVAVVPPSRIELRRPTLEDIFVEIVSAGKSGPAGAESLRAALRQAAASEVGP